jgi:hypothetical protein
VKSLDPRRGDWIVVWAFAAVVRLVYLSAVRPPFTLYYWDAATNLLHDGSLSLDGAKTAMLEPLYPLFLAAVRFVIGDRPVLVEAIQALVAAAGAACLYSLSFNLTGRRRVALWAALLFAVYPLLIRHGVDGTESALLTTLLIAFADRFVVARDTRGGAVAGAWLGLAMLTRAVAWPLIVIAPIAAAAKSRAAAIAMAGVAVLLLAPYALRNYALNEAVVPARGGINLFIANNAYTPVVVPDYGPDILVAYGESKIAAAGLADLPITPEAERQRDAAYRRLAFGEIRAHPFAILSLKIRNVAYFFSPFLVPRREISSHTTIRFGEQGQTIVENGVARPLMIRLVYSLSYGVVAVLAAIGVYRRRGELAQDTILWCILITFVAVHTVFFPATRYRAPVEFVLLFYAGVAAAGARR